ncbi:MAG: leucyl aminopeptidase [Alphaproteobacteria bacterium]|nr:leucyl aminopeptidase [Alphaproteobacteria bacterium]
MKISFQGKPQRDTDLHVITVAKGQQGKAKGPHMPLIKALLECNPDFKGEAGELITAVVQGAKGGVRVGLLGIGDTAKHKALDYEIIGGKLMAAVIALPVADVFVEAPGLKPADIAAMASGVRLRCYEFKQYKTKNKEDVLPDTFVFAGGAAHAKAFATYEKLAAGVHWARDLSNEPPNVLYPESYARRVTAKLKPLGVKVSVLDDKALTKMGFGAMMAVGKASEHLPRLVLLEYKGPKAKAGKPVALVGKGITFDTGGYSLKSGDGMVDMKYDMAGSAAVAGAMYALAASKAPVHVVAALALAENMISDEGYRPDDILTSLSGQTIQVTNTDAEGRLVLCDAMWHVQQTYKPRAMVDIATLTGAAMVALGEEYAGVFTNDEALLGQLRAASLKTGDKIWHMPLDKSFDKAMDSHVADMRNAAATRFGGSSTGAAFLQRFVQKGVAWAHIDMAPVMVNKSDTALGPRGATGFGARLLADWVMSHV